MHHALAGMAGLALPKPLGLMNPKILGHEQAPPLAKIKKTKEPVKVFVNPFFQNKKAKKEAVRWFGMDENSCLTGGADIH